MLLIRCDWCGKETAEVKLSASLESGCACCSEPDAHVYGPAKWYSRYNIGGPDRWECDECSDKRFAAQRVEIAQRYADVDASWKRANAKSQYGDDDGS